MEKAGSLQRPELTEGEDRRALCFGRGVLLDSRLEGPTYSYYSTSLGVLCSLVFGQCDANAMHIMHRQEVRHTDYTERLGKRAQWHGWGGLLTFGVPGRVYCEYSGVCVVDNYFYVG